MMDDVLVFCPIYRLEAETVRALVSLEWEGAISLLLQRDNPYRLADGSNDGKRNHLHQYQRAQEVFLKGSYEAMLIIESDIIPPADTLARLVEAEADLAYGTYLFRQSGTVNLTERYYKWPAQARNIGESLTIRGLWRAAKQQGIVEVSGSGLGCLLIRRRVLEETPFDYYDDATMNVNYFDWPWTVEVYRRGYQMKGNAMVWCGHVEENGRVIWPR
jgi:hypothetical protein